MNFSSLNQKEEGEEEEEGVRGEKKSEKKKEEKVVGCDVDGRDRENKQENRNKCVMSVCDKNSECHTHRQLTTRAQPHALLPTP